MGIIKQTGQKMKERIANSHNVHRTQVGKQRWIEHYSQRMLKLWSQWETDLGVSRAYVKQIRSDLADFYMNPLKKMFIEATY